MSRAPLSWPCSFVQRNDWSRTAGSVGAAATHNSVILLPDGNAETNNLDDGKGTMEAIYWGSGCGYDTDMRAKDKGPWVQTDLENGCFGGNQTEHGTPWPPGRKWPQNTPWPDVEFVTVRANGAARPADTFNLHHPPGLAHSYVRAT